MAALALIARRLWQGGFNIQLFFADFAQFDVRWLAASLACLPLAYAGRAWRWEVMMRPLCPRPNRPALLRATLIGFTATVLFGRAGELVRPYLIANNERVSFSSQVAAWFLERLFDTLVVLAIFGLAVAQVRQADAEFGPRLAQFIQLGGQVVLVLSVICLGTLFVATKYADLLRDRLISALTFLPPATLEKVQKLVDSFLGGLQATRYKNGLLYMTVFTLFEWSVVLAAYACLFRAYPYTAQFTLLDSMLFLGFVGLGSVVQIPGVGGGFQIASVLILTEYFNLPLEAASTLAVVLWLVMFVLVVPFGLLSALQEGINFRRLRQIEKATEEANQA